MLAVAAAALVAAALMSARFLPAAGVTPDPLNDHPQATTPPEHTGPTVDTPGRPTGLPTAPLATIAPVTPNGMRVGIVAGHSGYDPGAVCPDGLTEAEVNLAVADSVARQLAGFGFQVDLLDEYDPRLAGYVADALVSIHADSCEVLGASGFKCARVTDSAIPEAEDRLVACLYREYQAATHLPPHPNTITDNMTSYHAFMEIDPMTPGAIIEMGFLLEDREMLVSHQDLLAAGIVKGIACFLTPTE